MYGKITFNILLIISLAVIQLAFISGLPAWFKNLNLITVVLVFILALGGFRPAIWWALGLGLLFDIYSFLPFGVYSLALLFSTASANFFLVNFFTNRSLYSFLAIMFFTDLSYGSILYFLSGLTGFWQHENFVAGSGGDFLLSAVGRILMDLAAVLIVFYLLSFLSNKLKPVFLVRHRR